LKYLIPVLFLAACKSGTGGDTNDTEPNDTNVTNDTYTVTLNAGDHGTLVADPAGPDYHADDLVNLTATPDDGYRLDAWTGTDNDASTELTNTVTVDGNETIGVTFAEITADTWTLTLDPGTGGSITADPVGPTYTDNTTVTLNAVPDDGFSLQTWTGTDDDSSTSLTNHVTMHADTTVAATFVEDSASFTLTIVTTPTRSGNATWGSVHATPPDGDYNVSNGSDPESTTVVYPEGTVVTLEAHQTVATWGFTNWVMPDNSQPTTCSVQVTMDADKTVTANFPLGAGVGGVGCP